MVSIETVFGFSSNYLLIVTGVDHVLLEQGVQVHWETFLALSFHFAENAEF